MADAPPATTSEPVDPTRVGGLLRIRIDLAYDGSGFSGWATQPGQRTVQDELEEAIATVLRLPEPWDTLPRLVAAGRTDAGVHARGQVAHLDVLSRLFGPMGADELARRLNGKLGPDVRILRVARAPGGFDARFSALSREYRYRVCPTPVVPDPLRRIDTLTWSHPLDLDALRAASALLLGEHDFAAYCRRREGATTIRALNRLDWERDDQGVLVATVVADAFCHSMVRSLVGALLAVGDGRRPVDFPASLLVRGARAGEVTVAAPHGLTLIQVAYPPDEELAVRAARTRAVRTP
jgi:tRNA pseudouridine38-40 synthase